MKFNVDMPLEHIRAASVKKIRNELVQMQETHLAGKHLADEVDALIAAAKGNLDVLASAASQRYQFKLTGKTFEPQSLNALAIEESDEEVDPRHPPTMSAREFLLKRVRQFYRRELTELEQYVLIQIFDQTWKDHLYAMDMLKSGIGLHSFAEKDPRILYKKEGFEFFRQMMVGVRDKVTDLIFRFRVVGQAQSKSNYRETAAIHEDAGGYGVAENIKATASAVDPQESSGGDDQEGGAAAATIVKPIVNNAPRVGRNDLCPCGSGKKYKKCHGVNAA